MNSETLSVPSDPSAVASLPDAASLPANAADLKTPLLEVKNLRVYFHLREGAARAVDGVSFALGRGRTLGLVGESGCGKSITALTILGLTPPPGRVEEGEIWFEGQDLLTLDDEGLRHIRGNRAAMIFQEPMTALNPVFPIGSQIAEVLRLHKGMARHAAWDEAVRLLDRVRIPSAAARAKDYPHQLSGGMRQRAMIAMALACGPALLIADEPTTALDVTVQAQILALIRQIQREIGLSVLLITHDLGVVAETADDVVVMYAGMVAETASVESIFRAPAHPYTLGLMNSAPRAEDASSHARLEPIEGSVPNPLEWPAGCRFHPRCPFAQERCRLETPELFPIRDGQSARCFFPRNI